MIKSELFFEIFFKKYDIVKTNISSYIENPTEESIYDVRTSIRRLETAYSIVPNSSKNKNSEKIVKQLKEFFSFNSKVRDFDIILEKLSGYNYDPNSKLVLTLQKKKLKRLSKAITLADKLTKTRKLKIKPKKTLIPKFDKKILSLISKFKKFIPVVISDESHVKELHSMRKVVKKLRYVLELEPENSYQSIVSNMKQLQVFLGDVHDCDIFIWHVQEIKYDKENISKIIELEKNKRNKIYKSLVLALSSFEPKSN